MLRYFVDTNLYEIVAMSRTDDNGEARINLESFNAFYYFVVEYEGATELTTIPARVIDTDIYYTIILGESVTAGTEALSKISHELTFTNTTQTVRFIYNDAGNELREACLTVDRISSQGKTEICDSCSTSSAGTILCVINTNTTGSHIAYGRIETDTEFTENIVDMLTIIGDIAKESVGRFGGMGVYLAAYSIMALALLGTPFPYVSILLALIGLIFSWVMGILTIPYTALVAIVIIGALIMYKMKY